MKDNVMDEVKKLFKPEFINRIDEIMVFHQLNKEEMKEMEYLQKRNGGALNGKGDTEALRRNEACR